MSRPLEKLITAAVMVLTAPLLIVSAVLIRLEGGGSAIYRQTRVGRHGEEFEMLKLRTMIPGSDPVGVGTVVGRDDPRVTRIGRWLRRTSLDELPNLINVWRGEMALVGPRPTIPAQVADYTPHQHRRHEVRPGITGWAQVQGRAGIPWDERIELDVEYVENRSLRLDLEILRRTVWLTATGQGLAPD
ncbi:MAG: sugar transferase [Solirubrobacterales bacterium]|nr:sugar transferase [Solirubrobacterales bacterium]MCB0860195.1 sugar transferase [Solirubrobacterales bacterium]